MTINGTEQALYCPLTFIGQHTQKCFKNECAWWNNASKKCGVIHIESITVEKKENDL